MGNSESHPTPTHPTPTHVVLPPDINSNLPKCINCGKKDAYIDHFYNKKFALCRDCLRGKSSRQEEPKPSATHFFPPIDNNTSETYIRASRATTHAALHAVLPASQPLPFRSKKVKKRSKKRSINRGRKV
jgi:hypothetical protein